MTPILLPTPVHLRCATGMTATAMDRLTMHRATFSAVIGTTGMTMRRYPSGGPVRKLGMEIERLIKQADEWVTHLANLLIAHPAAALLVQREAMYLGRLDACE